MAGIDCHSAPLALREKLAFSKEQIARFNRTICQTDGVEGCVLLSTCNRTELYLSLTDGVVISPDALLCRCAALELSQFDGLFTVEQGEDALRHLFAVACGMESKIWGEDQILSQVKTAIATGRAVGSTDSILETLFRIAISAGKRMKREVRLTAMPTGTAEETVANIVAYLGVLVGKTALVIGNGEMGRLVAKRLLEQRCTVTMTMRSYRHGAVSIPVGCEIVPYSERYTAMEDKDIVISATASPHHTVTLDALSAVRHLPELLVDLAVPRDIDCAVASIEGVTLLDIDQLGGEVNRTLPPRGLEILQEFQNRFYRWLQYRCRIPIISGGDNQNFRFPLFINLSNQPVTVIGGGTIAIRRVNVLLQFGADITVISPTWQERAGVTWIARPYNEGDLVGATLAIAATDHRHVNYMVGQEAKRRNIPVSVADAQGECTFFFPAICMGEDVVAGVVSHGSDHRKTAQTAGKIRKLLEEC